MNLENLAKTNVFNAQTRSRTIIFLPPVPIDDAPAGPAKSAGFDEKKFKTGLSKKTAIRTGGEGFFLGVKFWDTTAGGDKPKNFGQLPTPLNPHPEKFCIALRLKMTARTNTNAAGKMLATGRGIRAGQPLFLKLPA